MDIALQNRHAVKRRALEEIQNLQEEAEKLQKKFKSITDANSHRNFLEVPQSRRCKCRSVSTPTKEPIFNKNTLCSLKKQTKSSIYTSTARKETNFRPLRKETLTSLKDGGNRYSPIKPNIYIDSEVLITENTLKREPKIKKKINIGQTGVFDDIYVKEYYHDIYTIMRRNEHSILLKQHFLAVYNPNVMFRRKVVNWLLKSQRFLHFTEADFYMTVRMFDSLLAMSQVSMNMYQLVILTSLWIVLKKNGLNSVKVSTLISLCGRSYTESQVLTMEIKILKRIDFKISSIEPSIYVSYYLKNLGKHNDIVLRNGSLYLLDCLCLSPDFSTIPISLMAASSVNLVLRKINNNNNNYFSAFGTEFQLSKMNTVFSKIKEQIKKVNENEDTCIEPFVKYSMLSRAKVSLLFKQ